MTELKSFYQGYLWGYLMAVSFPVGALGIRLVHQLSGGNWGIPLAKYYKAATRTWGFIFILGLPLVFGFHHLYSWSTHHDPHLQEKRFYLNIPLFALRAVFYFLFWKAASLWMDRWNSRHDISGALAAFYVLAGSFSGIDWVMSLDPNWYSTIFGFVFILGQALLAFCVLVCLYVFRERPKEVGENIPLLRDEGNLILTMVMLWAYVAFSQYLIIWMGNIPEEIRWYLYRIQGGWGVVSGLIIAGHFFVPFFLLLRRAWKEDWHYLAAIALWILLMRAIDTAWMVFPGTGTSFSKLNLIHLASGALVIGLYGFYFLKRIRDL